LVTVLKEKQFTKFADPVTLGLSSKSNKKIKK